MTSFDRSEASSTSVEGQTTQMLPVKLDDGSTFLVEVPTVKGRQDVAGGGLRDAESLSKSINGIVKLVTGPLKAVQPNKATVKLGLEIGIEQGSLVAAIVRGVGKTNLEITMEWTKDDIQHLPDVKVDNSAVPEIDDLSQR
ncbi:MAG: CU044_2847 family protein [Spirulina sp.]